MKNVLPILCILLLSQVILAGDLEPSAPPTGGTMKTLDEVEPRIPITSLPFTISTSGSYYLTKDLASSSTGIFINANDVTIDFCGFIIVGPGTEINCFGTRMNGRSNVEIRNGTIRAFGYGIYESSNESRNLRILDMRVLYCKGSGIQLYGQAHLVRGCTSAYNGINGSGSAVFGIGGFSRSTITNNTVYGNATSSSSSFYGISCGEGSIVTDNNVTENGMSATAGVSGINAGYGCMISGNTVCSNGNSTPGASQNIYGIIVASGSTVVRNTVYQNGLSSAGNCCGIYAISCMVDQNTAISNTDVNMNASGALGTNYAP